MVQQIAGRHHTFITKRFDRILDKRLHYSSAMTMTGNSEEAIRDNPPSYLEIAEFIQFSGSDVEKDLHQLWRRIVFNIAISNTDDHLRNHGFILDKAGWHLSPAFDVNPSIDKDGLALNIDMENNALDFELARSVGELFKLKISGMDEIMAEVMSAVNNWKSVAGSAGILSSEIQIMEPAFRV